MSELKYCQGPRCHEYTTKDRIRGSKGDKHYETRRRMHMYYNGEFCSLNCQDDWFRAVGTRAIDHFGRVVEAKRTSCDSAWYKSSDWNTNSQSYDQYYFINDLLGERRPITQAQYNDENFVSP